MSLHFRVRPLGQTGGAGTFRFASVRRPGWVCTRNNVVLRLCEAQHPVCGFQGGDRCLHVKPCRTLRACDRAHVASKVVSSSACVHACAGYHGERHWWSCVHARSWEFATGQSDLPGTPCQWLSSASGGRVPSWWCAVGGHARTYFDADSIRHECACSNSHH